MINQCIAESDY